LRLLSILSPLSPFFWGQTRFLIQFIAVFLPSPPPFFFPLHSFTCNPKIAAAIPPVYPFFVPEQRPLDGILRFSGSPISSLTPTFPSRTFFLCFACQKILERSHCSFFVLPLHQRPVKSSLAPAPHVLPPPIRLPSSLCNSRAIEPS